MVWHDVGKVSVDDVPTPTIQQPSDAIVRITTSAICGTDLHFARGTMSGMRSGTVLGHEAVGVVEDAGPGVRNFNIGDRVVIPSTIACGSCAYCRAGYYAQCDTANPSGKDAGAAFYGGPVSTGPFDGLQAEYARVPFAHANLVPIPPGVTDEQAVMVSDIFPAGWFGARLAEVGDGDVVAIFGAGPAGQLAALSARMQGAGRVLIVDGNSDRLEYARLRNAETIDFNAEHPVEAIEELTGIIGVYPPQHEAFPIGAAMNANLTVKMGNCSHRRYVPGLLGKVAAGQADPTTVWTRQETIPTALQAYESFGRREPGGTEVTLEVG